MYEPQMDNLPPELINIVLESLTPLDLLIASKIARCWRNLAAEITARRILEIPPAARRNYHQCGVTNLVILARQRHLIHHTQGNLKRSLIIELCGNASAAGNEEVLRLMQTHYPLTELNIGIQSDLVSRLCARWDCLDGDPNCLSVAYLNLIKLDR